MNILITGAKGFVGKNLTEALKNIRDGKDRTRSIPIGEIFAYDVDSAPSDLAAFCQKADFVYHLAGVNRPKDEREFMEGNFGFSSLLLQTLEKAGNRCPVLLSSSIQASLIGRYAQSDYGKSKKAGEDLFFSYGERTGATVLVYRFPNLFGKWCRPNYNSVIATFCHNVAHDLPLTVNDPEAELSLCYIDDLVSEMLDALEGRAHRCHYRGIEPVMDGAGKYCCVPTVHKVTLGEVVRALERFRAFSEDKTVPPMPEDSFEKKLFSTYLSYLPREKAVFDCTMNRDDRGSFTELLRTRDFGQVSVNISRPGITKGEHWHHSKWELFIVVSGHGLIQQRRIGSDEVLEFEVSGERIQAVYMLPGYTHNIRNLSDTEEMVTIMFANERFLPEHPDTFFEKVKE